MLQRIKTFYVLLLDNLSNTTLAPNQALDSTTNLNQSYQKFSSALEYMLNFQPRKLSTLLTMYSNYKKYLMNAEFQSDSMKNGKALGVAEMKGLFS